MFPKVFNPIPEKEKKSLPKFVKIIVLVIIVLAALIYLLFFSPFFKITNVISEGIFLEDADLAQIKGQNIILLNTPKIKSAILAKNANFGDIQIIRGLPHTLKIKINPYQATMIWKTGGRQYLVNKEGLIFNEVQGETDLPIVQDNKDLAVQIRQQVVSINFIEFIREVFVNFAGKAGFKIVYFEVNETIFQADALTDQGWLVKFDTTRSPDDQLEALKKFLAENKEGVHEYIDVRVEGKVFYM